jgi:hypothetical protein
MGVFICVAIPPRAGASGLVAASVYLQVLVFSPLFYVCGCVCVYARTARLISTSKLGRNEAILTGLLATRYNHCIFHSRFLRQTPLHMYTYLKYT